jgi:hypothetical protein
VMLNAKHCYANHTMRYRRCGGGAYPPPGPPVDTSPRLPASYAHRHPLKRRSWILLGGPAISLNIIIPISGISHILHSYSYRIRTPSGDCPDTNGNSKKSNVANYTTKIYGYSIDFIYFYLVPQHDLIFQERSGEFEKKLEIRYVVVSPLIYNPPLYLF